MAVEIRPAFYTLEAGRWRDYLNLLHTPYLLWHLSYVVVGAALAPTLYLDRLGGALLAFFLAVGVAAHALDELKGRPQRTIIPDSVLVSLAAISLAAAALLGVAGSLMVSKWLLAFVGFGVFIVMAYNLELWKGRFHSDLWFALAWGTFPFITSYWINALSLDAIALLGALACFTLSLTQRTLSNQVRTIRRKALHVEGTVEWDNGTTTELDAYALILAPERALRLLSLSLVVLAVALLVFRLFGPL